jgi:hypothetical protein
MTTKFFFYLKDIANIENVTVQYQWEADENPIQCTFECISAGFKSWEISARGASNGFYEKSTSIFSNDPVTGEWFFYLFNHGSINGVPKVKQVLN